LSLHTSIPNCGVEEYGSVNTPPLVISF